MGDIYNTLSNKNIYLRKRDLLIGFGRNGDEWVFSALPSWASDVSEMNG